MQKKVSIIIPFYSHLEWLYEAIESVFNQTYSNYEVILINDGSKEDLTGFLQTYGDRIIYIYQENAGPAAARNKGIRYSTGEYIAFEDSDDIWLSTKLEKQVAFMEKTGAKWSHVGFNYWWPESGKLVKVDSSRDYDNVYLQRHISTKIATPAVMLDRSIYMENDFFFPEQTRNGEDDQLFTMLSKYYPLALIQEPLVNVRMRGNNSQTRAIERFNLRATNYRKWIASGEELSFMIHFIYSFYCLYTKLFEKKQTRVSEQISKFLWIAPYILERIYVRYLFMRSAKDDKYIKRIGVN